MTDDHPKDSSFGIDRRLAVLTAAFGFWLLVVIGRAWYIAVPGRSGYVSAGEKLARRTVTIPAPRGSILDAGGRALVWSEHFYDLESAIPAGALGREEIAALKKVLADIAPGDKILRRNLTPGEVMGLEELIRSGVRVRIVGRDERITVDSPEVKRLAPEWEKKYDRMLAGVPGRMSVMFDRRGKWIRQSVKVISPVVPGGDVRLERNLREIEPRNGDKSNVN